VALVALQALERGAGRRYDVVLVDEAQDFNTDNLRFIVRLLRPEKDDLVVVADSAQNIFKRKFSWKSAGISAQGRTQILRTNYRNTKEILEFAHQFLMLGAGLQENEVPDLEDEHSIVPPEAATRCGTRPTVISVSNVDEEVGRVVETVEKWSAELSDPRTIAILYASKFQNGGDNFAAELNRKLHERRLAAFWLNDPGTPDAKDKIAKTNKKIVLSTIHSAKGLEFPRVLLCGLGNSEDDLNTRRMLIYVGMTRATDHLVVLARRRAHFFHELETLGRQ
jgi:superfamily I DNA/RNA helicase